MPFDIPNYGDVDTTHKDQSFPNAADIDILVEGHAGNGVASGAAVTAQGSPDMTVHVAAGNLSVAGSIVALSAADPAISAAASSPRRDLVVSSYAGGISVVAGTPVALDPNDPTITPVLPALPASRIALAAVTVRANTTSIVAADIVQKQVPVLTAAIPTLRVRKTADTPITNDNSLNDDPHLKLAVGANESFMFTALVWINDASSGAADFKYTFTAPSGATGSWSRIAGGGTYVDPWRYGFAAVDTAQTASSGTDQAYWYVGTIVNGATPGFLTFQWCQVNSNGNALTVRLNSWLRMEQIV
jgi:hypothetical protein